MRYFGDGVYVEVYDSKIEAMSAPGGMVFKWAYQRSRKIERLAKAAAPKRTGRLAASISSSYDKVPNGVIMRVSAGASYARYVHEGTYGPIVSPRGRKMFLHPAWGGHPTMHKWAVNGQRPQPFLAEALHVVMRDL